MCVCTCKMRLMALPLWTFKSKKRWPWARKAGNLQVTWKKQKDQGWLVTLSWGKSPHQDKNAFWWERVVTVGINITGSSYVASDNNFLEKISSLFEVSALPVDSLLSDYCLACLLPYVLLCCNTLYYYSHSQHLATGVNQSVVEAAYQFGFVPW